MDFFNRHPLAGIGLLLGPTIAIGSLILHAIALKEMGLPVEIWVALGLAIFFLSVIGMLMKWDGDHLPPITVPSATFMPSPARLASTPAHSENAEKEFVNISVEYLRTLATGKMDTEKARIVAPFVGKWIRHTATVTDVYTSEHLGIIRDGYLGFERPTHEFIFRFNSEWNDKLSVLSKGQTVALIGKIYNIHSYGLELIDCEFAKNGS
jgi:hypothetical protein